VWFHGRASAVPVYAPPYWTIPECKRLARPDPHHDDSDDMPAVAKFSVDAPAVNYEPPPVTRPALLDLRAAPETR
jgi:hypothetical protein